jgi:hypothetical protein
LYNDGGVLVVRDCYGSNNTAPFGASARMAMGSAYTFTNTPFLRDDELLYVRGCGGAMWLFQNATVFGGWGFFLVVLFFFGEQKWQKYFLIFFDFFFVLFSFSAFRQHNNKWFGLAGTRKAPK